VPIEGKSQIGWTIWGMVAAFGTYFCMYGFRKPFTAAEFTGMRLWGLDYKTVLVTSQVLGYTLSKFIGIKAVSEIPPGRRALGILILIGIALFALLLFGLAPPPYNIACLFLDGLPLGMVFGLVLGFLEGRRVTELLTAVLCSSFILAGGVTKSVGSWLLHDRHVSGQWMPFVAGLIFLAPLVAFVWMLTRIPPPDQQDIELRAARSTMDHHDRSRLFRRYALGLVLILAMYLLITILRSVRDDFAPEIWRGFGMSTNPAIFAQTELIVGLSVPAAAALGILIRDNRRAFFTGIGAALAGLLLCMASLIALHFRVVSPFAFMVLLGVGLYLPYVSVSTTIFERLVAMTRDRGTIAFLMYLVDAWGYLGYVAVMLGRSVFHAGGNFLGFFTTLCWIASGIGIVCVAGCWVYFGRRSAGHFETALVA